MTVVLDTNLTPELLEEGFLGVRSLSKIQTMRKEAGFEVMDRIGCFTRAMIRSRAYLKKNAARTKAECSC